MDLFTCGVEVRSTRYVSTCGYSITAYEENRPQLWLKLSVIDTLLDRTGEPSRAERPKLESFAALLLASCNAPPVAGPRFSQAGGRSCY